MFVFTSMCLFLFLCLCFYCVLVRVCVFIRVCVLVRVWLCLCFRRVCIFCALVHLCLRVYFIYFFTHFAISVRVCVRVTNLTTHTRLSKCVNG